MQVTFDNLSASECEAQNIRGAIRTRFKELRQFCCSSIDERVSLLYAYREMFSQPLITQKSNGEEFLVALDRKIQLGLQCIDR